MIILQLENFLTTILRGFLLLPSKNYYFQIIFNCMAFWGTETYITSFQLNLARPVDGTVWDQSYWLRADLWSKITKFSMAWKTLNKLPSTYSHGHFWFVKAHFMLKLTVFELETWFLVWMDVFDQNEDGSTHFLIFALFDIRFLPFLKTLKNQKCPFLS